MINDDQPVLPLHDASGRLLGVLISPELWPKVEKAVRAAAQASRPAPVQPEPLKDWEELKSFWDFPYPVDTDVTCGQCGASTQDWTADEPRVFRLKACNLGGLVSFECQSCQARVTKRHFKDKIQSQTTPYVER